MIDYNSLTQRAYDCAMKRGKITEETTVSEILCDCMVELGEAWEESKSGRTLVWYACVYGGEQCHRCGAFDIENGICESNSMSEKPEGVAVELADAVICLLTLSTLLNVEIKQGALLLNAAYLEIADLILLAIEEIPGFGFGEMKNEDLGELIEQIAQWVTYQGVDFEAVLLEKMAYNERRVD